MNPTTVIDPSAPPPQPPQPPRSSFSCDRHPAEQFTGFCPTCLCERLTTLDNNSSSNTPSSSRRPSSASAAIKALFNSSSYSTSKAEKSAPLPPPLPKPSRPNLFFPELRRTKSFSASKNEALGLNFEPQRKSCDVRGRNTLWSLFSIDDDKKCGNVGGGNAGSHCKPSSSLAQNGVKVESFAANGPVFEETENEEDDKEVGNVEGGVDGGGDDDDDDDGGDEIRPVPECRSVENLVEVGRNSCEIVVEGEGGILNDMMPIKEHVIDLDGQGKKSSGGGGIWAAASVFSKKWNKWRRKQKMKKQNNGGNLATLPVEKPISRQYRETQSEIADYGFGRRSCDTDPRFSLDAGRISFDDPRYSLDEPRASWDGHLLGRSFQRMAPMVSLLEDAPAVHVPRSDMQIPVEEPVIEGINGVEGVPGGSLQTREYYSDSSRRRKSLDRSSSIRKTAAAVVAEIDDLKMVSNAKVSPTTADYFHGAKVLLGERDLRDSNSNSLRDDGSENFEAGNGYRDSNSSVIGNGDRKEKKSRRWSWKLWGFINRRNGGNNKYEDEEEKYSRVNGVERSLSESWQDARSQRNVDVRAGLNRNVFRSNSSVSWRNGNPIGGSFGSVRRPGLEMNGNGNGRNKKDEYVLERNRSARYSPSHVDNGLLRFYLTPTSGSRRGALGKVKANHSHSIARSVLRLY